MTLLEFIEARLAEDEATARAVPPTFDLFNGTGVIVMHAATGTRSVTLPSHVASFTARHDPARVLREVAAKRAMLGHLIADLSWAEQGVVVGAADEYLRLLAAPFADHPDYDPTWSPT